jgi:hypothetical protein
MPVGDYKQLGVPQTLTFTPEGGTETVLRDIQDFDFELAADVNEYDSGEDQLPDITVGMVADKITVKTSDATIFAELNRQGMRATAIVLVVLAPYKDGAGNLQHDEVLTYTMPSGYLAEPLKLEGSGEGKKPGSYGLVFKACRTAAGTAVLPSFALAAEA